MIDHILGKPSTNWKRIQVILVALLSLLYLRKKPATGPKIFQRWNSSLQKYTPWQVVCGTLTAAYLFRNAFLLLGLNAPEPLARLYSRNYYRATWILTALDAGFWTALPIKPKFLKDIFSLVFTLYYAIFADQAEEKVRKIRALITVPHLRSSWEKSLNPYLRFLTNILVRKRLGVENRFYIQRPTYKPHASEPIDAYLYYCGSEQELEHCDELVLDFPGGGFVTMSPPCHDEYLSFWAAQTRSPVLSINYGKAPEFPYPWAIEECFDAYRTIVETNGACLGIRLTPGKTLKIAMVGDSAGGNIATAVMYKILEHDLPLPPPRGIVLIYPCLDFNITSWMPPEQLQLIRAVSMQNLPGIIDSKNHLSHKSPLAVVPDKQHRFRKYLNTNIEDTITHRGKGWTVPANQQVKVEQGNADNNVVVGKAPALTTTTVGTRIAMTSRMSFFEDRIITPDLMRAMAILYIGPNAAPDLAKDYYLSPIVGPDHLLERFPPVYMICGEKDPFVDDTVIFGGRIRNAKRNAWERNNGSLFRDVRQMPVVPESPSRDEEDVGITFQTKGSRLSAALERNGSNSAMPSGGGGGGDGDQCNPDEFNEAEHCTIKILEGMSHAFMQMLAFLPEAKGAVRMAGNWFVDILENLDRNHLPHRHDVPVRTVSHQEMAELGRMSDREDGGTLRRTLSRGSSAVDRPIAGSSASSASTAVSPEPSSTRCSPDRGKAEAAVSTNIISDQSCCDGTSPSSPPPYDVPTSGDAALLPSVRSPRAARRRAAVDEKCNSPDVASTSSFVSAHEEWERKNVIASERELLDRRRGDFDRYFNLPESIGPPFLTPLVQPADKENSPTELNGLGIGEGPA